MSVFIKELVRNKLRQLTPEELLHYSKQYGFSINRTTANNITQYLKTNPVDPFHANGRDKMFQELSRLTDTQTANKAQHLFQEIIKSYGLEYLFNE
ncbi:DUF2624 family protein [Virgibacillus ainsalahensis]